MATTEQLRAQAAEAARTRWNHPHRVDQRVDAIVESARRKLEKLPPLTPAQRAKLAALMSPASLTASQGGGSDELR